MPNYSMKDRGDRTIYDYLYQCIREDILNGSLPAGDRLPSKRLLARDLNISVTSVENAYAQLVLEGYIHGETGRGFFVNDLIEPVPFHEAAKPFDPKALKRQEEPTPAHVLDFKANRSSVEHFPFATWSKLMRTVLSEHNAAILGTVPYNGLYELRGALAAYLYRHRGIKADPEQIIIGAGTEYLYSRLLQVLGFNTVMAMEDPGYKKFSEISASQGTVWDYIPMDDEGMRIDYLRNSSANVIHVSPSNHFPTGTVMPITRRLQLLQWAREKPERYIIEDDYDSELRYAGRSVPPMYAIDEDAKVIYMNTFSKSLVPSIRISYMILPPYLLERYQDTMSFYSCTVSAFEQLTLAHFISEGYFSRHINRMKQIYKQKRDLVLEALKQSDLNQISEIREANAGTHFLLHVNTALTDKQIKAKAEEQRIELALLSDYTRHQGLKSMGTLIINYAGLEPDQVGLAIEIIERVFENDIARSRQISPD
ncbi:MAG: PLP-dependent aminotransferase family protein [Clostridiales bacterium]|nr:PLP-dependent aminotransferase family protein [Clostridiales bacterium]